MIVIVAGALAAIGSCDRGPTDPATKTAGTTTYRRTQHVDGGDRNFALLDQHGKYHELGNYRDARAVVLFIHGVGCPIVRNSLPALNALATKYAREKVEFLMLNANPQDVRADALNEPTQIPILFDENQLVAEKLNVTRTAEALLIDTRSLEVVWRGPLDDRFGYGADKGDAGTPHLDDALRAFLAGAPLPKDAPPAKGCAVSFLAPRGKESIRYATDIVPILRDKCVGCHSEGGIGPFVLKNHRALQGWSQMIQEVVMTRQMPPYQPDLLSSPHIDATSALTATQARTLVHWLQNGAPKDSVDDPLVEVAASAAEEHSRAWILGKPDVIIEFPERSISSRGVETYLGFSAPLPIEKDEWLKAWQVKSTERQGLHHLTLSALAPGEKLLDPIHNKMSAVNYFGGYIPGKSELTELPAGTGLLIKKGSTLGADEHYVTLGRDYTTRVQLGLYFHKEAPPRRLITKCYVAVGKTIRIPPHASEHKVQMVASLPPETDLYGVLVHMHLRGSYVKFTAAYSSGARELLLSVPKYDFGWQHEYWFTNPKHMPEGTRIVMDGAWDNSSRNRFNPDPTKEIRGARTVDGEMFYGCVAYVGATRPTSN